MAALPALFPTKTICAPPGAGAGVNPRAPGDAAAFLTLLVPPAESGIAPAQPRHDDAGPGKDVPAAEDAAPPETVIVAPPIVPIVLPPPVVPAAEPAAARRTSSADVATAIAPPAAPATPLPEAFSPTATATVAPAMGEPVAALPSGSSEPVARLPVATPSSHDTAPPPFGLAGVAAAPSLARRDAVSIAPADVIPVPPGIAPRSVAVGTEQAPARDGPSIAPAAAPVVRADPAAAPESPSPPPVARVALAAQVFASARHRAARDEAPAPPAVPVPPATDTAVHAVHAAAPIEQAAIDVARRDWPEKMIARIDAVREAQDTGDTRIRLVPDALGAIDVSLRREGDTVAVQLNAALAETRALLAEAQPRLDALAEAKGLRLHTSTGDGTGNQPAPQRPPQPDAPPRARAAADTDESSTDTRIA